MMVAANGNGAVQKNYVAAHLSQRKPKRNQPAINRLVPGEIIFLEPTCAGGEQLFARCKHSSKMQINLLTTCLFESMFAELKSASSQAGNKSKGKT